MSGASRATGSTTRARTPDCCSRSRPTSREERTALLSSLLRTSQRELQPRVVEPAVHPELRDAAAVDEAAAVDVPGALLFVREGVEHVVRTDRHPHASEQL